MATYLVLYRATTTAQEQMAAGTPEQAAAGMQAWSAWAGRAGDAVVDLGAPLSVVDPGGDAGNPVGGFSILTADDTNALQQVLEGHPHTAMGGTIEILEFLSIPGM